jgi:hypothetical protein
MRSAALVRVLVLALGVAVSANGEEAALWSEGEQLAGFELADQHGDPGRLDQAVRVLLFTGDMDAGKLVRAALEGDAALQDLAARGVLYVSDIHRMPRVIARVMALPRMRRRPYRMLLDRSGDVTRSIPRAEGQVTVVELDRLRVVSIRYAESAEAVALALGGPGAAGTP